MRSRGLMKRPKLQAGLAAEQRTTRWRRGRLSTPYRQRPLKHTAALAPTMLCLLLIMTVCSGYGMFEYETAASRLT